MSRIFDQIGEAFVAQFENMAIAVHETAKSKGWWDVDPDLDNALTMLTEYGAIMATDEASIKAHQAACDAVERAMELNEGEAIALMHSELSEGLEGLRHQAQDDHLPEFSSIEVELADTVIRIMDLAKQRGWRVAEAVVAKARYNQGRPVKHGGKRF